MYLLIYRGEKLSGNFSAFFYEIKKAGNQILPLCILKIKYIKTKFNFLPKTNMLFAY